MTDIIIGLIVFTGGVMGSYIAGRVSWKIAKQEQMDRFKLATLNKRLEKYQEAYALWWELWHSLYNDNNSEIVSKCENWWKNNCLHLEPDSRQKFHTAYLNAFSFKSYGKEQSKIAEEIFNVGELLEKERSRCGSPSLKDYNKHKEASQKNLFSNG